MKPSEQVTKLKLVKPDDAARAEVIKLLEDALERAKTEDGITDAIVLLGTASGDWNELATPTMDYTQWLGRVQTLVFDRQMSHYQHDRDDA